jgi:hypothetical protein
MSIEPIHIGLNSRANPQYYFGKIPRFKDKTAIAPVA